MRPDPPYRDPRAVPRWGTDQGKGNVMNGYADNQLSAVPDGVPEPADLLGVKGAHRAVTAVLVVVGIGGLIGTLKLLAGPLHVKGHTPDVTGWLAWGCEICPEDGSLGRRTA